MRYVACPRNGASLQGSTPSLHRILSAPRPWDIHSRKSPEETQAETCEHILLAAWVLDNPPKLGVCQAT